MVTLRAARPSWVRYCPYQAYQAKFEFAILRGQVEVKILFHFVDTNGKVAKHGRPRDRGPRSSGRGCEGCQRRSCSRGVRLQDDHDSRYPDDWIISPEGMSILSPWLAMMITVPFSETKRSSESVVSK